MSCSSCGNELPAGSRFCNKCGTPVAPESPSQSRFASPESYTPKHLAEKILTSKAALEGERKQVTVLFADLKGSMALLADRDPEEARKLLDPVIESMMEAVHRYRELDMIFWLEKLQAEMKEVASALPRFQSANRARVSFREDAVLASRAEAEMKARG